MKIRLINIYKYYKNRDRELRVKNKKLRNKSLVVSSWLTVRGT